MAAALKLEEDPRAARNDAFVTEVGNRFVALGHSITQTTDLHHSDKHAALNALRRQLDLEMQRLELAADEAWELSQ